MERLLAENPSDNRIRRLLNELELEEFGHNTYRVGPDGVQIPCGSLALDEFRNLNNLTSPTLL